jgi:hypothetical protein
MRRREIYKFQIRSTNVQNANFSNRKVFSFEIWILEFFSSFDIRISDFSLKEGGDLQQHGCIDETNEIWWDKEPLLSDRSF